MPSRATARKAGSNHRTSVPAMPECTTPNLATRPAPARNGPDGPGPAISPRTRKPAEGASAAHDGVHDRSRTGGDRAAHHGAGDLFRGRERAAVPFLPGELTAAEHDRGDAGEQDEPGQIPGHLGDLVRQWRSEERRVGNGGTCR